MNGTSFDNMDSVFSALEGLGELASHEVSAKALKAVAQPIAEDVRARLAVHSETGETAADIGVAESREAGAQGDTVILVGAHSRGRAYILRFLEFGTVRQRATPVVRPAWDAARSGFTARCVEQYQKAYRSIIAKYSGKAAA